jgi:AcrR family transcriptional regulator
MRRKSISRAKAPRTTRKRPAATLERDEAIVKAALQEFTRHGFAAARMDDIARRAGVGKGTIYLRFKDKEALFEGIIRQEISPLVNAAATALKPGESVRAFLERTVIPILRNPGRSRRTDVLRLLIGEAPRFPKLAEFYFRTIVKPGLEAFGRLARHAFEEGELSHVAPIRYPQLLLAPVIIGLLWSGLFDRFHPLDVEAMLRAHFDQMFPAKAAVTRRAGR